MTLDDTIMEITKILDKWLVDHNFPLTTKFEADFGYYHNENVIAFSLITTKRYDILFNKFIEEELGIIQNFGTFALSFFHELGHYMTYDDITDEEYGYCAEVKRYLGTKKELTDYDILTYFNLPIEKKATEWGVNYILDNCREIAELEKEIKKELDKLHKV